MNISEFNLIDTYFKNKTAARPDVIVGIGDDAALVTAPGQQLVMAMDTLISGVHFPAQTAAFDIGFKALAVNLSDLAAMGAKPAWLMLALTMPKSDASWIAQFSEGLLQLAHQYTMQLIGGDTTRGALTITVQVSGFVPGNRVLRRQGAKVGDGIYVSGTLGDAGLGLLAVTDQLEIKNEEDRFFLLQRLNRPTPRIVLGLLLRNLASSAIDISDGLLADLTHILKINQVGAHINTDSLPLSAAVKNNISMHEAKRLALTAGDDYELCFTVSHYKEKLLQDALRKTNHTVTKIGEITAQTSLQLSGFNEILTTQGYQHF